MSEDESSLRDLVVSILASARDAGAHAEVVEATNRAIGVLSEPRHTTVAAAADAVTSAFTADMPTPSAAFVLGVMWGAIEMHKEALFNALAELEAAKKGAARP